MPNYRIPNNSNDDANGMWKLNAVQRARKGDEWPDTYVPYTPSGIAFSRSTGSSLTGIYTGVSNANGTNIGTGYPMYNGWGFSQNNNDAINFEVTTNGSQTSYVIEWVMLPRPYAGSSPEYNDVAICIGTGGNYSGSNRAYEDMRGLALANSSGVASYQKWALPATGNIYGNTTLQVGVVYSFGLSWSLNWNDNNPPYGSYFSGNWQASETHAHPSNGDNITMSFTNFVGSYASWAAHPYSNGTSNSAGSNYLFGITI